jgi:hypothetical protein
LDPDLLQFGGSGSRSGLASRACDRDPEPDPNLYKFQRIHAFSPQKVNILVINIENYEAYDADEKNKTMYINWHCGEEK